MTEAREGEIALPFDPATTAEDGRVHFIGRVRSPWLSRQDCPKNMTAARERDAQATIEIDPAFRPGLAGLERASHVIVLSWFDRAARNLIIQKPRHASEAKGVFALRSPVRPNPIGLHVARLVALDMEAGLLTLDAIDLLDGTPVIDLKPYFASTDAFPDAVRTSE
ncbi:tRNA (N6-threonylcarbamoyladenosine(37)-N6)-methyltransferase TrmO [Arvimicrobium flavum]|uniref:tRNA (N6-threonylcarbamoyladenosine(37)-N6)-methyltransferase TrmO n=1 Tax=Arvimicrobium flavum TaxID=3393320 RepID=UPI00237AEEA7|nr:tRNA (N6-threonylcarbamoyladenosine(37)-N6)-methyltransferase TrmO [Mesorhizobium shangrilense]